MGYCITDLTYGSCITRLTPKVSLPGTLGRLYNAYAASARSKGLLYNGYVVTDSRTIAPLGWHIPTQDDYNTLITAVGSSGYALKSTGGIYWQPGDAGDNASGFDAMGVGYRAPAGDFVNVNLYAKFWSSTLSSDPLYIRTFCLSSKSGVISNSTSNSMNAGHSLRFVKDDAINPGSITDTDGNQYATVKIGEQVWLAENYQGTKFRDGSAIAQVIDKTTWAGLTTAACCWYNNTVTYSCNPVGFRLPTIDEWNLLASNLGGTDIAGGKLKEQGSDHWNTPNLVSVACGFNAMGGGYRDSSGFSPLKNVGSYHSIGLSSTSYYQGYWLQNSSLQLTTNLFSNYAGSSIRFIRNNKVILNAAKDFEHNPYDVVTIGEQVWLTQNWKSPTYRDGTAIPYAGSNGLNFTTAQWAALTTPGVCAYNHDETLV
jgi:uncharacterized protein (TIGR02145 family)